MAAIIKKYFGRGVAMGLEGGYSIDELATAIGETLRPFLEDA